MKTTCNYLVLLALLISFGQLFASPQMPDYIIYKKDTIPTYNLILEDYLQKQDSTNVEKLFGLNFRDGASLNCWRSYQAIFQIDDAGLFLVDIINCGERSTGKIDKDASIKKMKSIFGKNVVDSRVYADWFSGDISFPLNNNVLRWDGVFYKIYKNETLIKIANGKVLKVENIENYVDNPLGINREDKNKISDILFEEIKKVKWKNIDKFDCSEKYLVTIDKSGNISNIIMPEYQTADTIDKYWDRNEYNYCLNNMRNALNKLKFDIIKDKGQPISEDIYIEIWFEDKKKIENWTR